MDVNSSCIKNIYIELTVNYYALIIHSIISERLLIFILGIDTMDI